MDEWVNNSLDKCIKARTYAQMNGWVGWKFGWIWVFEEEAWHTGKN